MRWSIVERTLYPDEVDERRRTDCQRYDKCLDEVDQELGRKPDHSWVCSGCRYYKPKPIEVLREEAEAIFAMFRRAGVLSIWE